MVEGFLGEEERERERERVRVRAKGRKREREGKKCGWAALALPAFFFPSLLLTHASPDGKGREKRGDMVLYGKIRVLLMHLGGQ